MHLIGTVAAIVIVAANQVGWRGRRIRQLQQAGSYKHVLVPGWGRFGRRVRRAQLHKSRITKVARLGYFSDMDRRDLHVRFLWPDEIGKLCIKTSKLDGPEGITRMFYHRLI